MPAQLTSTWTAPNFAAAASSAAATSSALVTSQAAKKALSPICLATSTPADLGRSRSATLPPPVSSRSAVARPSPDAPPVITATDPAIFIDRILLGSGLDCRGSITETHGRPALDTDTRGDGRACRVVGAHQHAVDRHRGRRPAPPSRQALPGAGGRRPGTGTLGGSTRGARAPGARALL